MSVKTFFCVACVLVMAGRVRCAPSDAEVAEACAALSRNAKDPKALGVIQAAATDEAVPPAMRGRAMVLCALPFLQQMNTNQFDRIVQVLMSACPDDGPALLGVTESDWLATCPSCKGTGAKANGGICLECRGSGRVVEISPNVKRRYGEVLSELRVLAAENIRFAEQSQKALAVRGVKERLAAVDEVLAAFPGRPGLAPLAKAREAALAEIAEAAAKEQAQEARARLQKERNALFEAERGLPLESIPALVRQIDAFLAGHPKSEYEVELEILKANLQARQASRAKLWRYGGIFGGLVALLFAVSLVRDWARGLSAKKERLTLPGMERVRPDQFTDPLSDQRAAAAKRKETETSEN